MLRRFTFDVPTIGETSPQQWLAVAQAALTGYLEQGGTVAPSQFYGAARHALLHSLCTSFLAALILLQNASFSPLRHGHGRIVC